MTGLVSRLQSTATKKLTLHPMDRPGLITGKQHGPAAAGPDNQFFQLETSRPHRREGAEFVLSVETCTCHFPHSPARLRQPHAGQSLGPQMETTR